MEQQEVQTMAITNILIKDGKQIDKNEYVCGIDRTDNFEVLTEFTKGLQVWNISREGFNFKGYIPLVNVDDNYNVVGTKYALKVGSEELALYLLRQASFGTIDRDKFNELVENFNNFKKGLEN